MLIDFEYRRKTLIVSYVDKSGDIKIKNIPWANPTKFVECESNDPQRHPIYKSWDGYHVKSEPVSVPDRYAVYEFLDGLPEKDREEIFEFNTPKMYFVDIETQAGENGYSEPVDASEPILSLSVVHEDKIILLGLEDMSDEVQERIRVKTNEYFDNTVDYSFKYIKYESEFDMLYTFFHRMVPLMPLITGWNFVDYDWVYLINRARNISNTNPKSLFPNKIDISVASPTGRIEPVFGKEYVELPKHRMIFDYMQLYKIADTSIKVKESNSLDFVSSKLVNVKKIQYNGSLQKLYEEDFETFMYYNSVDSVLVQKIHEIRNYISIVFGISTIARIKLQDVVSQRNDALGSLAITEGVLRGRFRDMDNTVLFKSKFKNNDTTTIAGGYVSDPIVGMNRWCVTYDFSSLYPTIQRQFFISPENYVGIQDKNNKDICSNGSPIDTNSMVICSNGAVFQKRISPTINMLEEVFADRKKNKNIMMDKISELKKVEDEIKKLETELYSN